MNPALPVLTVQPLDLFQIDRPSIISARESGICRRRYKAIPNDTLEHGSFLRSERRNRNSESSVERALPDLLETGVRDHLPARIFRE